MPDRDAQAPPDGTGDGARVSVRDFRISRFNQGMGYAPGSQFETSEEKRSIQTPGLTVQVPLQIAQRMIQIKSSANTTAYMSD